MYNTVCSRPVGLSSVSQWGESGSAVWDVTVHLPMSLLGSVQRGSHCGATWWPSKYCRCRCLQVTQSTIVSWWLQGRAGTCVQHPWWAACGWSRNGWSQARYQKGSCSGPGCTCSPSSVTASCAWSPGCSWGQKKAKEEGQKICC